MAEFINGRDIVTHVTPLGKDFLIEADCPLPNCPTMLTLELYGGSVESSEISCTSAFHPQQSFTFHARLPKKKPRRPRYPETWGEVSDLNSGEEEA